MRIWVVATGEPMPAADGSVRLLRAGNLCAYLQSSGHDVTWWTSSFDHVRRCQMTADQLPDLGYAWRLIPAPGYQRNLGVARLFDHALMAWRFDTAAAQVKEQARPDVIWCSYPPIELAFAATRFGRRHDIPVVLDVRDLWPDAFLDALPAGLRPLGRVALAPYFLASRRALMQATGLVGITQSYLEWAANRAGRAPAQHDRCFPMGYPDFAVTDSALAAARAYWDAQGIRPDGATICFFGTLGLQFDIDTVIDAARLLADQGSRARFVLCGAGSSLDDYRARSAGLGNVLFPGHVDVPRIKALMERSLAGLAPYRDLENFRLNVPNKVFEYAAGGLPVLSAVDGEVGRLLHEHGMGAVYSAGNARALADLVSALATTPQSARARGARARALFEQSFDARVVSRQIESYLLGMVAGFPSGKPNGRI